MKLNVVGVAILCAVVAVIGQVQAAPADLRASQLVERLKELLRERNAQGTSKSVEGESAVDLENDGHPGPSLEPPDDGRSLTERGPGLTQEQKNQAVEYHNKLRKQEHGSNMESLRWSDRLAQLAQNWADRCAYGHRPPNSYNPKDYGFSSVGENIWAWSRSGINKIPDKPIQDWYDEKQYYDYNSNYCRKPPCGHYTTVTWAKTTHVGCGYAKCGRLANVNWHNSNGETSEYMVCNYGPWGAGQQPYKRGRECTECDRGQFFCTDGMCDSSCSRAGGGNKCVCRASCRNGRQTSDCKCECRHGYSGASCSEACVDKDRNCGANPGWPKSWCTDKNVFGGMMYDTVNAKCPKMCGHCEARKRDFVDEDAQQLDNAELEFLVEELQKNN